MEISQAKQIMRVADDAMREIESSARLARQALLEGKPDTAMEVMPRVTEIQTAQSVVAAVRSRWEEIRQCLGHDAAEHADTHAHG